MKKLLVLMLSLIASVAIAQDNAKKADGAPAEQKFKAHVLTNAELDKLLSKPDQLLIIDVRRPDELTNIGGFPVYLSVQAGDLEKSLGWIPKNRTLVTVSNHAARAGKAADLLTSKGFKVAGAVGAQTYEQQGGKLTKIAAKTAQAVASNTADKK